VRVKLERINCDVSRSLPPDGDRSAWIDRLKGALSTASMEFVEATLYQLQAAARLPNSGVSEIAVNAALGYPPRPCRLAQKGESTTAAG
jgi:hypothetical protein